MPVKGYDIQPLTYGRMMGWRVQIGSDCSSVYHCPGTTGYR